MLPGSRTRDVICKAAPMPYPKGNPLHRVPAVSPRDTRPTARFIEDNIVLCVHRLRRCHADCFPSSPAALRLPALWQSSRQLAGNPSRQPSASQSLVRVAGVRSGASRKCAPVSADSPTNRRSVRRVAGWPGCQPIAGDFRVRADCFAQWQAFRRRHGAKAGRAHDGRGFAGLGSSALACATLNCVHHFPVESRQRRGFLPALVRVRR